MADIVWTDVTNVSAGLSAVAGAYQTDILAYVNGVLEVSHFGGEAAIKTRLARIYLAAHLAQLWVDSVAGAGGPVTSETAGDISRGYAVFSPPSSDTLYDGTTWGKQYRLLVRASRAAVPMVT